VDTLGQKSRFGLLVILLFVTLFGISIRAEAAPYAAMVIDARSGEVLHSRNADTRLHPASLTKMMTLYVVFDAVRRGEVTMDSKFKISKHAASEPPSKLGLQAGQTIALRYLVRAAAVKSANDAATALAEGISGSEAAFARRMNRTAKALGMTRTTFKNAHGLTESGHLSTARDMTTLGRRLFYDYPQYYNLFSRRSTHAGIKEVANTNRRLLGAYKGADGIKTGYTRAAGFNLVASAERGNERVIATVFGGRSSATRNAKVAELLDLGFKRAPSRVAVRKPAPPVFAAVEPNTIAPKGAAGKTIRVLRAVKKSPRPIPRPVAKPAEPLLLAMQKDIEQVVAEAAQVPAPAPTDTAVETAVLQATATPAPSVVLTETGSDTPRPKARIKQKVVLAAATILPAKPKTKPKPPEPVIVTRMSTSGGRHWGVNVGRFPSRYKAERVLLKTALKEMNTLDGSLRKIVKRKGGFDANFLGLSEEQAQRACDRLEARGSECKAFRPG
jgi:D-alanyl-D-alanine carboxypeptidase